MNALYEAHNKTHRMIFWNKSEAEDFVSQFSPSTGWQVGEIQVWGSFRLFLEGLLLESAGQHWKNLIKQEITDGLEANKQTGRKKRS